MGSVIAAGTSYATHGTHMIPVYVFYSMFGWQRTGDQMWALGDQLGRGFLLGATAGPDHADRRGAAAQRRALAAAGLGQSRRASPTTRAWAYEIAYIVRDALRRMYDATPEHPDGENIFYYLTVYNEPYPQPPAPVTGGTARRASCGPVQVRDGTGHGRPACPGPGLRGRDAMGAAARSSCWPPTGACPPTCGRPRRGPSCAGTALAASRATCCTPRSRPGAVRDVGALRRPRAGRRRVGLDARGAGPDRPLGAWPVHVAGHRRLRLLRHPPGRPPVLPRGRRVDHPRGAVGAGPLGGGAPVPARPGDHPVQARPPRQRGAVIPREILARPRENRPTGVPASRRNARSCSITS